MATDRGASLHPSGAVAQLAEHLLCKQGVVGSIPISSTRPTTSDGVRPATRRPGDPEPALGGPTETYFCGLRVSRYWSVVFFDVSSVTYVNT